ncbi:DUF58 domain-containing protein [soil metagenome]
MRPFATPKLVTYVGVSAASLFLSLLLGRVEMLVVVTPMITALVIGLALTKTPGIDVMLAPLPERCLEREAIEAALTIEADVNAEAQVAIVTPRGFASDDDAGRTMLLASGIPRELDIGLTATRWGRRSVGRVACRVRGLGGFLVFEEVVDLRRAINVYPALERMTKQIPPPETQVFAGNYVSRAPGDGLEFSGVRPFEPGDSRRRVNWRVTSRRSELHVNDFHSERNADVVLFLDTFADVGPFERTSLDVAVRGAATLARHYLARKDRVGLVAFGGLLGWLRAGSGQPHLHRIVDYLIGLESTVSYARKDIGYLPHRSLPQLALILAFSPLVDERALTAFIDLHARGYGLVVIDTLAVDSVGARPSAEDRLAHRAWKMLRDAQRHDMEGLGIPVVPWSGEDGIESVAAQLPAARRMPRARRA